MQANLAWNPPRIVGQRRLPALSGRLGEGGGRCAPDGVEPRKQSSSGCPGPTFSIVTVVLNNSAGIQRTMESVLGQSYPCREYIVIDGGSTDGTVDAIRSHDRDLEYWVSEPDRGISDAFNKGISLCSGEWVGLLNAGDWYEKDALGRMAAAIAPDVDFLYAACMYHATDGTAILRKPDKRYDWRIPFYMPQVHHPSVFVRRSVYESCGGFDPGLKYAMDYEFLLRIHKAGRRGRAVSAQTVNMPEDGLSVRHYPAVREEVMAASIRHGLSRWMASLIKSAFLTLYAMRQGRRSV